MSWRATAISAVTASSSSPASWAARSHSSSDARRVCWASGRAGDDVAVMDGQTLRVAGHVVRLTGLTAPTTVAGTAALQLAALVRDQRVACQLDGAKAGGNPTARCEAGGTDLNRALVAEGWAEARADAPGLKQAEMVARERHLGVWAGR